MTIDYPVLTLGILLGIDAGHIAPPTSLAWRKARCSDGPTDLPPSPGFCLPDAYSQRRIEMGESSGMLISAPQAESLSVTSG